MNPNYRVQFERPLLQDLTRHYTVVDLHFHSRYSDGFNHVQTIAARARKLGIGVAITDHNAVQGAVTIDRYKDILTIPGIEVTSAEGAHVLVYFYDIESLVDFYETSVKPFMGKDVMASLSLAMETIIERARSYRSLVVFPHPHSAVYTGICNPMFSEYRQARLLEQADGIEVINAGNLKRWNLKCALLGFNLGKTMTAGSDGHNLFQLGKAVTYTDPASDRALFLDALAAGRNGVIGKETHLLQKGISNGYKLGIAIRNSPHTLEKNVRFSYTVINSKSRRVRDSVRQHIIDRFRRKTG
jgi:predicted metal-dependent phosphoesterase TrpH